MSVWGWTMFLDQELLIHHCDLWSQSNPIQFQQSLFFWKLRLWKHKGQEQPRASWRTHNTSHQDLCPVYTKKHRVWVKNGQADQRSLQRTPTLTPTHEENKGPTALQQGKDGDLLTYLFCNSCTCGTGKFQARG